MYTFILSRGHYIINATVQNLNISGSLTLYITHTKTSNIPSLDTLTLLMHHLYNVMQGIVWWAEASHQACTLLYG